MTPYLLPFLSVILGFGLSIGLQPKKKKSLKLLLAFSGSFLLSMTVVHLLPEIYQTAQPAVGLFIMLGILLQIILEYCSQGAEHGHVHGHDPLTKIPWLLLGSLCLHAFLEGLPVSQYPELALGISIHHLPIAIILTLFLINGGLSKIQTLLMMLLFALMTPTGAWIASSWPAAAQYQSYVTALVIGILFHISSTIIFESSEGHKFNLAKITVIILGFALAYFI